MCFFKKVFAFSTYLLLSDINLVIILFIYFTSFLLIEDLVNENSQRKQKRFYI